MKNSSSVEWTYSDNSFVFLYMKSETSKETRKKAQDKFKTAIKIFDKVKKEFFLKKQVINNLFLQKKHNNIIKVLNSISGMNLTTTQDKSITGSKTATILNKEFFMTVLDNTNIDQLEPYLSKQIKLFQEAVSKTRIKAPFGIIVVMVSLMEILNIPLITFSYIQFEKEYSNKIIKLNCKSTKSCSDTWKFSISQFSYNTPEEINDIVKS